MSGHAPSSTLPGTAYRSALLVVAGAGLGLLSARFVMVGSGLALVPWALVAVAVGAVSRSGRRAGGAGVLFGFTLAAGFMVFGYTGEEPLVTRLPVFAVFGVVGAACAGALAVAGRAAVARIAGSTDARPGR